MATLADFFRRREHEGAGMTPPAGVGTVAEREPSAPQWQFAARVVLGLALLAAGIFTLSNYLRALAWAVVIAIALWPLFERASAGASTRLRKEVLPLLFTLGVGLVFVLPFAFATIEVVREAHNVLDMARQAEEKGIPAPAAISKLPQNVQAPVTKWWEDNLAHSGWAKEMAQRIDTSSNRELGRNVGRSIVHRVVLFGFALLALFFLFREGHAVAEQCRRASARVFGPHGERVGRQMIASVHGTVNGLVLVGLAEGVVFGVVYALAGVPHAILFAAFTGVAAMIPFAAAIGILGAAATVLAAGKTVAAVVIVAAGFATTFAADHFVRPSLIGGTTKLPFLWVLLGILGGVETFGLLGLFLGPAIMAALVLIWREIAAAPGEQPAA